MVRTKADSSARKAVAAKAPRKALASTGGGSGSSAFGSPKAGNKYAGGNTACPRPVPDWQKGISSFFTSPCKKSRDKENSAPDDDGVVEIGESSGAGCSSQGSSSSTSSSSQGEKTLEDD